MNSYDCLILYIIKCRTLCKTPDINWLIIDDVGWGTKIDHEFVLCRHGTNATGGLK